jgi:hypothetical protein
MGDHAARNDVLGPANCERLMQSVTDGPIAG